MENEKIFIDNNEVLKALGMSIVTPQENYREVSISEKQVNCILENKNIDFKHKKEIFEKIKLLQLFSDAYIGPDPRYYEHLIFRAKKIFEVNDEKDFKDKIKELDSILQLYQKSAMHPFETIKKRMTDKIKYRNVIF